VARELDSLAASFCPVPCRACAFPSLPFPFVSTNKRRPLPPSRSPALSCLAASRSSTRRYGGQPPRLSSRSVNRSWAHGRLDWPRLAPVGPWGWASRKPPPSLLLTRFMAAFSARAVVDQSYGLIAARDDDSVFQSDEAGWVRGMQHIDGARNSAEPRINKHP
jgi:hypothetical protein